jgi:hypothetical protein
MKYTCINKSLKKNGSTPAEYETIVSEDDKKAIETNGTMSHNFYFVEIKSVDAPKEAVKSVQSKITE